MSTPRIQMYTSDACPYCQRAKRLLTKKGVEFEELHLGLGDFEARQRLAELPGRRTVPQTLFDDTPVVGYDYIKALDDAGALDPLLGIAG